MSDAPEETAVTPPVRVADAAAPAADVERAHVRIDHLSERLTVAERALDRALSAIDHVAGTVARSARAVAAVAPQPIAGVARAVESVAETVADLIPCPEHPDAPQTPNGCTAAGCTFSGQR